MAFDPRLPFGPGRPLRPAANDDAPPRADGVVTPLRRPVEPKADPAARRAGTAQRAEAPRLPLGLGEKDQVEKKEEAPKELLPTTGLKWAPRTEPPKNGGLHQLTLATLELPAKDGPALDFATYRPGFNNRGLLGAIAKDLEQLMGVKIPYGFGQELEALAKQRGPVGLGFTQLKSGGYRIGEKMIDQLLEGVERPKDKEAIASFTIAHEYFHAYLSHADTAEWSGHAPKGFRVKQSDRFRKVAELQVDYLATKYLMLRGLPTDAILKMFEDGDFPASKDYPSGKERADNVRRALEPGFALELFQNDVLDCLAFLDFLAGGPPP